jgi:hypothetical protein
MQPTGNSPKPPPPPLLKDEDEPSMYCPRCDSRLQQSHCKLVCLKCGYYMSCADYY